MEENTTLNQEVIETEVNETLENEDENLFEDSFIEEAKEVEETKEESTENHEDETPAPFLEIKYNKETKGLTQDEARELAQKGMNYDHINEKYTSLNKSLEALARLNGMDVNGFLNSLNDTQIKFEESKELNALKEKYPEANEELLAELASKNVAERMNSQLKKFEEEKTANDNAVQERATKDIETLKTEYGLSIEDINNLLANPEFADELNSSKDVIRTFLRYQHNQDVKALSEAQSKAKIVEQNEANRKKSLGNISNAGEDKEANDFFSGLNSI